MVKTIPHRQFIYFSFAGTGTYLRHEDDHVFTSNIFAILGLRSLYFLLAGAVEKFAYLKVGLSAVLIFVGAKMLLIDVFKMPVAVSLAVIGAILGGSILASLVKTRRLAPKQLGG